ncbi:hypothetical protein C1H46_040341 [Malus baccata]|uniref:Protein kinase domain-containing protein n=2 Tax=Malus baccata TaxID=106549 RepID=A0A540KIX8_MALBA|nr:hypothetical protein C1H46_040341 [Malus baccata]
MFHHSVSPKTGVEQIIPLRMAITVVSLLLFVQLPKIFASEFVIQSRGCSDHIAYSSSHGHKLFYINGNSVEKALFCTAFQTYYANGCILEGDLGIFHCALALSREKQIIHRDVKSSNILLTESMRAKVADFGFAKLGPMDSDRTHILTKVKGTVGYLDPEYMKTYQLTPKSDVYSFGILLIEILTGRRPVELKRPVEERVTLRWAFKKLNEGRVAEMVDPLMEENIDAEVLMKIFELAIQCAAPIRVDRPEMKSVGEQLWTIRADYLKSVKRGQ